MEKTDSMYWICAYYRVNFTQLFRLASDGFDAQLWHLLLNILHVFYSCYFIVHGKIFVNCAICKWLHVAVRLYIKASAQITVQCVYMHVTTYHINLRCRFDVLCCRCRKIPADRISSELAENIRIGNWYWWQAAVGPVLHGWASALMADAFCPHVG